MAYRIKLNANIPSEDEFDFTHENPRSVQNTIDELCKRFPNVDFEIWKDNVKLSAKEFQDDLHLYELQLDEESRLPSTYRPGWGSRSDIVEDGDERKSVWKPPNPDDEYK